MAVTERLQADSKQQIAPLDERLAEAIRAGRRFDTYLEQLFWPKYEVRLLLKSPARSLSLHEYDEPILKTVPTKLIYEDAVLEQRN